MLPFPLEVWKETDSDEGGGGDSSSGRAPDVFCASVWGFSLSPPSWVRILALIGVGVLSW